MTALAESEVKKGGLGVTSNIGAIPASPGTEGDVRTDGAASTLPYSLERDGVKLVPHEYEPGSVNYDLVESDMKLKGGINYHLEKGVETVITHN